MNRNLRFATATAKALQQNARHQFAASHALKIFRSQAIYTFIPKNACSTFRLSVAIANGVLKDGSQFNWIHANNDTFRASLEDLVTAAYTFVLLRDPYLRLASCFLDKFVSRDPVAWQFFETIERRIHPDDITFSMFVNELRKPPVLQSNPHWRPQINFLVYETYDDFFAIENLQASYQRLKEKAGLEVVDARNLTSHGIDRYQLLPETEIHSGTTVKDLSHLMHEGRCPSPKSLYDDATRETVAKLYADDLLLYQQHIGLPVVFP